MNALDYYAEQVEQFISILEEDIKDGEGTIVTQTKLATYKEVLEHLEEIKKAESHALKNQSLKGQTLRCMRVPQRKRMLQVGLRV